MFSIFEESKATGGMKKKDDKRGGNTDRVRVGQKKGRRCPSSDLPADHRAAVASYQCAALKRDDLIEARQRDLEGGTGAKLVWQAGLAPFVGRRL